jgi:DNA-binding FadR family transcriptional regulator
MNDQIALPRSKERAADAIVREIEARIVSGAWPTAPSAARAGPDRRLRGEPHGSARGGGAVRLPRLDRKPPRYRPVVRRPAPRPRSPPPGASWAHLLRQSGSVKNLYDTRILLEGALVRFAALNARKDDIAALTRALQANEAAIPEAGRFYATDVAFHAVLYDIPRNPILPAVHKAFTAWLSSHWERMPRSPERNRVNWLRHGDILQAIRERDPDAAEAALASHLNAAWEYVRGTFEAA